MKTLTKSKLEINWRPKKAIVLL